MIDNYLGVTVIGLRITVVGLLSTIVPSRAVIGMEAVSYVMGLFRVAGDRTIIEMSLNLEKHEKIAMLAISALNNISSLVSRALSDDTISGEEYSLM